MCAAEQLPEVEAQTEEADEGAFRQTFRWSVEVTAPERIAALVGGQMEDYRVPIRYLPPGKLVDLWYQFLSWVETQRKQGAAAEGEAAIPSWATFYRCWTELFHKRCLRFREKSQHAECDDCFRFRQQLGKGGISAADRVQIASRWRAHLTQQWMDRSIYWSLRFASRSRDFGVLVVIADSMDKTKWCYPKYHQMHRLPHELENFSRPRMVLTAVLAHGWRTSVYVSDDETVNHGANMVCEVLSRTLQSIFEEKGIVPQHLCLQCDNTVAFSKNSDTHLWVAYAVARGLITSGSVNYLTKGHTHEDVDGFLSELLPTLRRNSFNSVADVIALLREDLAKKVEF